jgi:L-alanine-DL-glutamate epimerase-like enolase superfamily enzyme
MTDQIITADMLPGFLADLARITTPEIAITIARKHGGRRLYIPRQPPVDHPLCDLVGRAAALLIADHLGGDRHEVPAARTILRWDDAHRLRASGKTHAEISELLNLTQAYVSRLLAGAPIGTREAPLQPRQTRKSQTDRQRQLVLF